MFRKHIVLPLVMVCSVLVLGLGCQQAAPQLTPKPAEGRAAATPTKAAEKVAEKPVRGGTLRYVATADPTNLDPHLDTGGDASILLYDFLIWQDLDQGITKEGLATDWTVSGDGKSITFKLRAGVKFHDGTDLDAAAAKFNIERVKDPATKSIYRTDFATLNTVEVVDGLTLRVNLARPDPLLLTAMGAKASRMVSPAAIKKYGVDFPRNPVGSGPFQLVEWVAGDHLTFKRFEGYWKKDKDGGQLPYLEQVVRQTVPDETVAFNNLRTGQVHLYLSLPAHQLPTLKGDPNLTYTTRAYTIYGVYLNTKRPPFDNKALRQAVALAVDRQGLAANLGEGASAQASVLHPSTWAYDEKVGQFPDRDLAKAKAKMAEAGYAGGLKTKMPAGTASEAQMMAQVVQANLKEIGLEAEIEVLGSGALGTRVRLDQNYGIAPQGSIGMHLADPGYLWGQSFHSQGGRNYFGPYSNPQVDQLLDKAGSIYDQKERTALYREIARIVADDVPFLPLYVPNNINALSKKVRNYVAYTDNYPHLGDVWLTP